MNTFNEKLHKLKTDRIMLRILLHKLKVQLSASPSDELYRRRASYRKRLTKLNNKIKELRKSQNI